MKSLQRNLFSSLAIAASLTVAACAPAPASPEYVPDRGDQADEGPSAYVGLWVGLDGNKDDCQVEVLGFEEHVDTKVPGVEEELAPRGLTRVRRNMHLKLSMQVSNNALFDAKSVFDRQNLAYTSKQLTASLAIDDVQTEEIEVILNLEDSSLEAVHYTHGRTQTCGRLEFFSESLDPVDPEPSDETPEPGEV